MTPISNKTPGSASASASASKSSNCNTLSVVGLSNSAENSFLVSSNMRKYKTSSNLTEAHLSSEYETRTDGSAFTLNAVDNASVCGSMSNVSTVDYASVCGSTSTLSPADSATPCGPDESAATSSFVLTNEFEDVKLDQSEEVMALLSEIKEDAKKRKLNNIDLLLCVARGKKPYFAMAFENRAFTCKELKDEFFDTIVSKNSKYENNDYTVLEVTKNTKLYRDVMARVGCELRYKSCLSYLFNNILNELKKEILEKCNKNYKGQAEEIIESMYNSMIKYACKELDITPEEDILSFNGGEPIVSSLEQTLLAPYVKRLQESDDPEFRMKITNDFHIALKEKATLVIAKNNHNMIEIKRNVLCYRKIFFPMLFKDK